MNIGTATKEPMMVTLLAERKRGPTQLSATVTTTRKAMAMLATGLVNACRNGWRGAATAGSAMALIVRTAGRGSRRSRPRRRG